MAERVLLGESTVTPGECTYTSEYTILVAGYTTTEIVGPATFTEETLLRGGE